MTYTSREKGNVGRDSFAAGLCEAHHLRRSWVERALSLVIFPPVIISISVQPVAFRLRLDLRTSAQND